MDDGIDPQLRDQTSSYYEPIHRQSDDVNGAAAASHQTIFDPSLPHQHHRRYDGVPTSEPAEPSRPYAEDSSSPALDLQNPPRTVDLKDLKRPRACEACRQLKVRCQLPEKGSGGSCSRCRKANRQCIVTAPSRKRQKRSDTRVADLERKIDALTASLENQHGHHGRRDDVGGTADQTQTAGPEQPKNQPALYQLSRRERIWDSSGGLNSVDTSSSSAATGSTPINRFSAIKSKADREEGPRSSEESSKPLKHATHSINAAAPSYLTDIPLGNQHKSATPDAYVDVIERNIIDAPSAYRIFDRYQNEMQLLPIVVFAPGTKAQDIRRSKPVLFLGILAAACSPIRSDLQPTLHSEVLRILADRIICRGEKSMELVQALLVITIFYNPPERYEELHFNQLIHISAVMGIDLGLGKRVRPKVLATWMERMAMPDPNAAETRRTWLGLYYMSANAAMSQRRALLVRWSAYMDESLEMLDNAADALPSDRWLAYLVRMQHIAEDVGHHFSMDDAPTEISITDPKIQFHLKTFERQLDECRRAAAPDMPQGWLWSRQP